MAHRPWRWVVSTLLVLPYLQPSAAGSPTVPQLEVDEDDDFAAPVLVPGPGAAAIGGWGRPGGSGDRGPGAG